VVLVVVGDTKGQVVLPEHDGDEVVGVVDVLHQVVVIRTDIFTMAKNTISHVDYLTEAGVTYRRLGNGKSADAKCGEREFCYTAVNHRGIRNKVVNIIAVVGDEIDMLRLLNYWNRHSDRSGLTYYIE
jgi:hypothetical protein